MRFRLRFHPILLLAIAGASGLPCVRATTAAQNTRFAAESQQAYKTFEAGDFVQTIAIAQRALAHGDSGELRDLLGKAYAQMRQPAKAMSAFEAAVRLQPGREAFRFDFAQFLLKYQQFPVAIIVLERAQRQFPQSAQIALALGVAYYCQHRYNDTVRMFLRTIDLKPDIPQPYVFLGRMLYLAGPHLQEIAAKCAAVERTHPSNPYAPLLHAKVLVAQLGDASWDAKAQEAAALLQKAITLNKNSSDAYFVYGCLMDRKMDYPKAAELLEQSIRLKPNDAIAHYRLARVYVHLGKRKQADAEFAAHARLEKEHRKTLNRQMSVGRDE